VATITKRTVSTGETAWRVQVRKRGFSQSETFARLTDAKSWARLQETRIDQNKTAAMAADRERFGALIERYIEQVIPGKKA
jgi:hypothetical protein